MRKSIDVLLTVIQQDFHLNLFSISLLLFCATQGKRSKTDFLQLFRYLIEGLEIKQKSMILPVKKLIFVSVKSVVNH